MKLSQKVRHHVFFWDTVYIYECTPVAKILATPMQQKH